MDNVIYDTEYLEYCLEKGKLQKKLDSVTKRIEVLARSTKYKGQPGEVPSPALQTAMDERMNYASQIENYDYRLRNKYNDASAYYTERTTAQTDLTNRIEKNTKTIDRIDTLVPNWKKMEKECKRVLKVPTDTTPTTDPSELALSFDRSTMITNLMNKYSSNVPKYIQRSMYMKEQYESGSINVNDFCTQ